MAEPAELRTTSSRVVYVNRWTTVREDEFVRADGSSGIYGVVDKPDFAIVVPMDEAGFHLVEQYRYPAGDRFWEFPQGTLEGEPGAAPEEIARRELAEETGFRAADLRYLRAFHESYGITGQRGHAFVATGLTPGEPDLGPEEAGLVCAHVPFAEFPRLVAQGRITDAATLAVYALLLLERGAMVTGPRTIDQVLDEARARLRRLTPAEAHAAAGDGAVLVDIRPGWQRRDEGEVPGALIVERNHLEWRFDPRSDARLPEATGHDVPVLVLCSEGYTSSLAAAALQDLGLRLATDVEGGFRAWQEAGLPTTHPAEPTPPVGPPERD